MNFVKIDIMARHPPNIYFISLSYANKALLIAWLLVALVIGQQNKPLNIVDKFVVGMLHMKLIKLKFLASHLNIDS